MGNSSDVLGSGLFQAELGTWFCFKAADGHVLSLEVSVVITYSGLLENLIVVRCQIDFWIRFGLWSEIGNSVA